MSPKSNYLSKNHKSTESLESPQEDFIDPHATVPLDEIDRRILRYLQEDGKASLRKLANSVKVSVTATNNHLNHLKEKGVIKNFIAVVDCCKIGYHEILLFFIQVDNSVSIYEILEDLEKIESINTIYQVSGNRPIFGIAKCVEKTDQIKLIETIKKIPGIQHIETQVVMQRIKEDMRVKIPNLEEK